MTQLRTLVVIAHHGESHRHFVRDLARRYRSMPRLQADVVVTAEQPKDCGPDVAEVRVGLPDKNPWSLPFAHQQVFAERVDRYDLFVYSEDDIGVTERTIDAFLAATPHLAPDEIAGFLRYEVDADGKPRLNDLWGHYHCVPGSARRRGPYLVAETTNEHAGFYVVTQAQLRRALASGGLSRGPRVTRYHLPETAATDIYTGCGFKKVYCVSHADDFLIHHLPQKYLPMLDVTIDEFRHQVAVLERILDGQHPATELCAVESPHWPMRWPKSYFEPARPELLDAVPAQCRRVLSVGAGFGKLERALQARGHEVTALPLDSVHGGALARHGVQMVYGELRELLRTLPRRSFDAVVSSNLLHLQPDAAAIVRGCAELVAPGGALALTGVNLNRLTTRWKRRLGLDEHERLRSFERGGFCILPPSAFAHEARAAGLVDVATTWFEPDRVGARLPRKVLGELTARNWLLAGRRAP
ncbi:MAG: methyltransferase domain-containing protein [Planctomycetes bacterium]|nr:methyltransferase domain-containing protein [Planctomycetota bacterium]